MPAQTIKISGARQHNLKNLHVEIPKEKLVVVTGLSGSGKSSLAFDTLYASGVTELYSLIAATAATRLGLAPRFAHLDSTSFHVDGRYNSDEESDAHVMHITRGYSRDQRPDLNQVMLDLIVEHHAGIPILMKPLSGNHRDAHDFGQLITDHMAQLQITSGTTFLVADSAL